MINKFQWPLILFVIVITCLWQGLELNAKELPSSMLRKPVPAFSLPSLSKPSRTLTEKIFQGQTTVLHVWASWCRGCSKQLLFLSTLPKTDEYQLVGLNYKDSKNNADQWLNKLGNPYKVIIFDATGRFGIDLGVIGTPSTFIIDSAGIIRYRHFGTITEELWNKDIVPQLNNLTIRG